MATLTLYAGLNDSVLELQVKDTIGATDLSGATVAYDLKDAAGTSVDSGSMSYVGPSGLYYIYRATIADTVPKVLGKRYTADIICNGGPGLNGQWPMPVQALAREE